MKIKREDLRPMSEVLMPKDGEKWGKIFLLGVHIHQDDVDCFVRAFIDERGGLITPLGEINSTDYTILGWLPWPELEEE